MMNVYFVETNASNEVVIVKGNKWVAIENEFVEELYAENPVEMLRRIFDEREKDAMWDVDFDNSDWHGTFEGNEEDFMDEMTNQHELIGTYERYDQ
jgi:hypothetical protein